MVSLIESFCQLEEELSSHRNMISVHFHRFIIFLMIQYIIIKQENLWRTYEQQLQFNTNNI